MDDEGLRTVVAHYSRLLMIVRTTSRTRSHQRSVARTTYRIAEPRQSRAFHMRVQFPRCATSHAKPALCLDEVGGCRKAGGRSAIAVVAWCGVVWCGGCRRGHTARRLSSPLLSFPFVSSSSRHHPFQLRASLLLTFRALGYTLNYTHCSRF